MASLAAELKAQGVWRNVTLVAASDMGRTLSSNGLGTDHAWGGNYFVLGGAVRGGRIVGKYPGDLTDDGPLNLGRGRLIPTTSCKFVCWPWPRTSTRNNLHETFRRFSLVSLRGAAVGAACALVRRQRRAHGRGAPEPQELRRTHRTRGALRIALLRTRPLLLRNTSRNKQETDGSRHSTAPPGVQNALCGLVFRNVCRILLRLRQKISSIEAKERKLWSFEEGQSISSLESTQAWTRPEPQIA